MNEKRQIVRRKAVRRELVRNFRFSEPEAEMLEQICKEEDKNASQMVRLLIEQRYKHLTPEDY
jgi:hypothetical protein